MMTLHHVGLTVRDLEASVEFYCSVVGCRIRARSEAAGGEEVEMLTGVAGAEVAIADLDVPNGGYLELLQYVSPPSPPLEQARPRPGHTHLAFHTDDVDTIYRRLMERGAKVTSPPVTLHDPGSEWDGARAFYATDPDGRTVEFVTMRRRDPKAPASR
jgi:catechol 2,3-dioxygenase-like lactoylglutathione lyase family enzyme